MCSQVATVTLPWHSQGLALAKASRRDNESSAIDPLEERIFFCVYRKSHLNSQYNPLSTFFSAPKDGSTEGERIEPKVKNRFDHKNCTFKVRYVRLGRHLMR